MCLAILIACDHSSTSSTKLEQTESPLPLRSQSDALSGSQSSGGLPHASTRANKTRDHRSELFLNLSEASGVHFSYSNGRSAGEFAIIESLGGGVAMLDFDLDGNLDLMFAGGGTLDEKTVRSRPCGLFRNLGEWTFRNESLRAAATADKYFSHGVHPGDFDGDGFDDLAISGYGGVQLLQNMGDGTFVPLESLITNTTQAWSSSLAWADLDNNGHLDLYVAHYVDWSWAKHPICPGQGGVEREVCAPREFAGMTDVVYMNEGVFPFRPESKSLGLVAGGKGLGVAVCDLNSDNFVDIYVANDTTDNFLYVNDGTGKFTENAVLAGVAGDEAGVSTGSMGVNVFDANGDQSPDIFVTNFERELSALYRNEGGGFFAYVSRQAGFAAYESGFVGFGTVSLDFDFDGDHDIVVSNGHVSYQSPHAPYRQVPLAFENRSNGRFERVLPKTGYFATPHTGRGLACGDLDNNGSADLAFVNLEDPVAVLQANAPADRKWSSARLVGTSSNRSGIGAKVVFTQGAQTETRFVIGGGSYLSHCDRRLLFHWGIDEVAATTITVHWPSGVQELFAIRPNCETVVLEGTGTHIGSS